MCRSGLIDRTIEVFKEMQGDYALGCLFWTSKKESHQHYAGVNVPDEAGQRALIKVLAEKRGIPVFLDEEIVHQY
ncbi:Alpha,alpha-trehalose-phosphate synthase [UDP-forming] 1 [Camellia lanceoleosa]|uniref:Alpha,alpha-trehalose-phosphate synthase [UDP-forming] 1 n=1 Tax=Camellia lanceoleosa TaxID=1840588 RepID=A0ACC0GGD9_9ERIC|nr:Alpha,alpha-trehalose-phosphate synthase [UDP-forming] 1 [Camellia lanceoleosa]